MITKNPKIGFTLVEILLGLTLTTAILVLITSITFSFIQTKQQLNRLADIQTQANNIMRTFREDIRWSESLPITDTPGSNAITINDIPYSFSSNSLLRASVPLISSDYEIVQTEGTQFFVVTNAANQLSLVTVNFTIRSKANNALYLSPRFTFTQIRTLYGPQ